MADTTVECIGFVPVDSGMVAIVDPCRADGLADEFDALGGHELPATQGYGRGGASVMSHTGDGVYPVFAERDADGRTLRLIIDFDPEGA